MSETINISSNDDYSQFLLAHPLFRMISPRSAALKAFIRSVTLKRYQKDELIYSQGELPTSIYLVYDGEVHIRHFDSGEDLPELIGIEARGNIFGEVSFLSHEARSSNARAALNSRIFIIPGETFLHLLAAEPVVSQGLLLMLSRRLRERIDRSTSEHPARIIFLFYPENSKRSYGINRTLARRMVDESSGPVALCTFVESSLAHEKKSPLSLLELMEKLPDLGIGEIKTLLPHATPEPFDILNGNDLFRSEQQAEKLVAEFPVLMGRLRRYYSAILIEAEFDNLNPLLEQMIAESTHTVLFRAFNLNNSGSLPTDLAVWERHLKLYQKLHPAEHSDQVITVSDEEPGISLKQLNRIINRELPLYNNHVRLINSRESLAAEGEPNFERGLSRLARKLSGTMRGLCLGGGGSRALAHIGMLEVMESEGIHFDAIIGTSMGAAMGAAHAMGMTAAEINRKIKEILPNPDSILDKRIPLVSFFRGQKLNQALIKGFGDTRFEELEIPFYCNASDMISGQPVIFEKGYLSTALRASSSLPGIFPPMPLGNYKLIDGAVLNNMPGSFLHERGCSHIVGVNVSPMQDIQAARTELDSERGYLRGLLNYIKLPPLLRIIYRAITMEGQELLRLRIQDFDYVLNIDTSEFDIFDFNRRDELIAKGRRVTEEHIDEIKESLSRKKLGLEP